MQITNLIVGTYVRARPKHVKTSQRILGLADEAPHRAVWRIFQVNGTSIIDVYLSLILSKVHLSHSGGQEGTHIISHAWD